MIINKKDWGRFAQDGLNRNHKFPRQITCTCVAPLHCKKLGGDSKQWEKEGLMLSLTFTERSSSKSNES